MAVHGLSLAESERYILASDPAHPDAIKREYDRRVRAEKAETQEQRDDILRKLEAEVGKPTVFLLGNLLHEDRIFLGDMSGGMEQTVQGTFRMTPKNNLKASEAVRRALKGWENFTLPDGTELKFTTAPGQGERGQPRSFVSPESMALLHLDILKELAARILEINGVTGEVEKKLQAALRQGSEQPSLDGTADAAATETKTFGDADAQA